jgi:hypothetical protein
MQPGQYFSIPLSNGEYACGIVMQLRRGSTREFVAGLMDWSGPKAPTLQDIRGRCLLAHGGAHVRTIVENDGEILGGASLEELKLELPLTLDQAPGPDCKLRRGYDLLRFASRTEQATLNVFSTWGYSAIRSRAEQHFLARR